MSFQEAQCTNFDALLKAGVFKHFRTQPTTTQPIPINVPTVDQDALAEKVAAVLEPKLESMIKDLLMTAITTITTTAMQSQSTINSISPIPTPAREPSEHQSSIREQSVYEQQASEFVQTEETADNAHTLIQESEYDNNTDNQQTNNTIELHEESITTALATAVSHRYLN